MSRPMIDADANREVIELGAVAPGALLAGACPDNHAVCRGLDATAQRRNRQPLPVAGAVVLRQAGPRWEGGA